MDSVGASSSYPQPILKSMLVYYYRSLDSGSLSGKPITDFFEVSTSRVLIGWLDNYPPEAMILNSMILESDPDLHLLNIYNY